MKYKKNYLSSVIVSLLAGFIYYQFGTEIHKSVDKVFSFQELEINVPDNSDDLLANFTIPQNGKDINTFFRKVKKKIKPENAIYESGIALNGRITQAKFQKPEPDRNVDFTAELNNLTRKKDNSALINGSKSLRKNKVETADLDSRLHRQKSIINKECFSATIYKDFNDGNGFEYNFVYQIDKKTGKVIKSKIKSGASVNNNVDNVSIVVCEEQNEDTGMTVYDECTNSCEYTEYGSSVGDENRKEWKMEMKKIQKEVKNKIKNINRNYNKNYTNNKNEDEVNDVNECDSDNEEIFMETQTCDDETL